MRLVTIYFLLRVEELASSIDGVQYAYVTFCFVMVFTDKQYLMSLSVVCAFVECLHTHSAICLKINKAMFVLHFIHLIHSPKPKGFHIFEDEYK